MKTILAATATVLLAACASKPPGLVLTAAEHCARMVPAIPAAAIALPSMGARIDLGPEIEGMKGRVLRMSTTTVAPGSVMPAHPHKDRPEIIFVREGSLTEIRNGTANEHGPGSVLIMTHDTVHGLENRSSAPVVYIAAPIAKQP